jgi:uncharacterized membrane protein YoaK (UPF0700 family)
MTNGRKPVSLRIWFVVLILVVVLGSIPATLARRRGRPFGHWWLYGAVLFRVALLQVLRLAASPPERQR